VKVEGSAELRIPIDVKKAKAATLRVGLHRSDGFTKPVKLVLNGVGHDIDLSYGSGIPNFMDYAEVSIDPENLRPDNTLIVFCGEPDATVTAAKISTVVERDKNGFNDEN
jgi:hypothetical protein